MAGLNKVILIGHLGKDPDTFTFDDGTKKASFPLATTESYRTREGEWQDKTEWHNVVGYRYLAEKNIAKGDMVYVEGKIKTRKYQDKDTKADRYLTEIIAEKINILSRKEDKSYSNKGTYSENNTATTQTNVDNHVEQSDNQEDDLPF
ncbi:MAG: single-stranded DNA-binding protein [Marinilabiliales bacterium]|nr:MAG: single-stranded DNA-binding protein [Marinilabiliales bacterium]